MPINGTPNRNNYYNLDKRYNSSDYLTFKTQKQCPSQIAEHFGAFSLRAAVRPPYNSYPCKRPIGT